MKRQVSIAALAAGVLLVMFAGGVSTAEEAYSEKTLTIARKLFCPVCEGQTVADSNATLALQMRDTIERKVQAGESEQAILDFFVARYGETILVEPPREGFNLTLWWIPVLVLIVAVIVVVLYLREHTGRQPDGDPERDNELEAIAREVLDADSESGAG